MKFSIIARFSGIPDHPFDVDIGWVERECVRYLPENTVDVTEPGDCEYDELEAILKTCSSRAPSGIRDRALLLLLRYCGLRIGEACSARKSAYRKTRATLQVVHKHKTKSGRRVVAVPPVVALALERWLAAKDKLAVKSPFLLCQITKGREGTQLSETACRQMVKRRGNRAGIDRRVHPHGFRHAFAAGLMSSNVHPKKIQKMLGHASLQSTDVYLASLGEEDVLEEFMRQPGVELADA